MTTRESRPGEEAAPEIQLSADHHNGNGHNGHRSNGLRAALKALGGSMDSWTVMSPQSDPFRMDTPANHTVGAWLVDTIGRLGITQQIHDRGIHYAILGQPTPCAIKKSPPGDAPKGTPSGTYPKGAPYGNTNDHWEWLQDVIKVARWLGYVDYEQIRDQRNDAPEIRMWKPPALKPYVSVDFEVYLPDANDLIPQAKINGFTGTQPYHLVLIGEKASLRDVLGPIADSHGADLYLPKGDPSDTMFYKMAKSGVTDPRPMVVLYFSDADPSGWNMPVVCSHKLQAFKESLFPELDFKVLPVGLTPDQVREYNLPSTPLKESERRADKWRAAMGVEQTEIDALATLRPDLLRTLARDAITPFYDRSLERRVSVARQEWLAQAQAQIDAQDGGDLGSASR